MNQEQNKDNRETGGQLHGLDNIMDGQHGYSLFGSLLPSLVPELAKPLFST